MKSYLSYSFLCIKRRIKRYILLAVITVCFVSAAFVIYIFADSQRNGKEANEHTVFGSHDAQYLGISGSELYAISRRSFVEKLISVPVYATCYNPNTSLYDYKRLDFAYLEDEIKQKWNYRITQGKEPGYMEIAVNKNSIKYFNELEISKTVEINVIIAGRSYPMTLKISGMYECDIEKLEYAVIDEKTRSQFLDKAGGTDTYDAYLYFDGKEKVSDRIEQLETSGITGGRNERKINGYQYNELPLFVQFEFLILFIFLVSPCSLLTAAVFYINIKNDEGYYIMLRDMGAEKKQLIKIIHLQALYIYLVSFPVGTAISILLMKPLIDMNSVRQSPYTTPLIFDMNFGSVIFLFLFCLLFLFLLTFPVVSCFVSGITRDGLRGKQESFVKRSSRLLEDGRGFVVSYSMLNTIRSRGTAAKYVSVVTLFFVILMSVSFLINTLKEDSEKDRYYGYDFQVYGDGNFGEGYSKMSEDVYEEIRELPFIDQINRESVTYFNISPDSESELLKKYSVAIHGMDTTLLSEKFADYLTQGSLDKLSEQGSAGLLFDSVSNIYMNSRDPYLSQDKEIVEMDITDDEALDKLSNIGTKVDLGTKRFTVNAVFKDYPKIIYPMSMVAFITDFDNYTLLTGDTSVQTLYIRCADRSPEGIKKAGEALSALAKPFRISVNNIADTTARSVSDMSDMNAIFKYFYSVMLAIVALTAVAVALFYIESKKEEREILRSIGCESGTLIKIQLLELNNIALTGCLLGIPINFILASLFLLINNAGNPGPTEMYYPVWIVALTAGLIYVLLLISGWLSLRFEKKGEGRI